MNRIAIVTGCLCFASSLSFGQKTDLVIPSNESVTKNAERPATEAKNPKVGYAGNVIPATLSALEKALKDAGEVALENRSGSLTEHMDIPDEFDETDRSKLAKALLKSVEGSEADDWLFRRFHNNHEWVVMVNHTSSTYQTFGQYTFAAIRAIAKQKQPDRAAQEAVRERLVALKALELLGEKATSDDLPPIVEPSESLEELQRLYQQKEEKTNTFVQSFRASGKSDEIIRRALRDQVATLFNLRLKIQAKQLFVAEARLKSARKRLSQREQAANQIIQGRIESLIHQEAQPGSNKSLQNADVSDVSKLSSTDPPNHARLQAYFAENFSRVIGVQFAEEPVSVQNVRGEWVGLEVDVVDPNGWAVAQGFASGDIVIGIGGWQTRSKNDLAYLYEQLVRDKLPNPTKIYLWRDEQMLFAKFDWPQASSAKSEPIKLLREAIDQTTTELELAEKKLAELKKGSKSPLSVSRNNSGLRNSDMALGILQVNEQVLPVMIKRNQYAAELGENHPTVKQLDSQLNTMKKELERVVKEQVDRVLELTSGNAEDATDLASKKSGLERELNELGLKKSMLEKIKDSVDGAKYSPSEYEQRTRDRASAIVGDDPLIKNKSLPSALRFIDQRIEFIEVQLKRAEMDLAEMAMSARQAIEIRKLAREIENKRKLQEAMQQRLLSVEAVVGE